MSNSSQSSTTNQPKNNQISSNFHNENSSVIDISDFSKSVPTTFRNLNLSKNVQCSIFHQSKNNLLQQQPQPKKRPQFYSRTASIEKRRVKQKLPASSSTNNSNVPEIISDTAQPQVTFGTVEHNSVVQPKRDSFLNHITVADSSKVEINLEELLAEHEKTEEKNIIFFPQFELCGSLAQIEKALQSSVDEPNATTERKYILTKIHPNNILKAKQNNIARKTATKISKKRGNSRIWNLARAGHFDLSASLNKFKMDILSPDSDANGPDEVFDDVEVLITANPDSEENSNETIKKSKYSSSPKLDASQYLYDDKERLYTPIEQENDSKTIQPNELLTNSKSLNDIIKSIECKNEKKRKKVEISDSFLSDRNDEVMSLKEVSIVSRDSRKSSEYLDTKDPKCRPGNDVDNESLEDYEKLMKICENSSTISSIKFSVDEEKNSQGFSTGSTNTNNLWNELKHFLVKGKKDVDHMKDADSSHRSCENSVISVGMKSFGSEAEKSTVISNVSSVNSNLWSEFKSLKEGSVQNYSRKFVDVDLTQPKKLFDCSASTGSSKNDSSYKNFLVNDVLGIASATRTNSSDTKPGNRIKVSSPRNEFQHDKASMEIPEALIQLSEDTPKKKMETKDSIKKPTLSSKLNEITDRPQYSNKKKSNFFMKIAHEEKKNTTTKIDEKPSFVSPDRNKILLEKDGLKKGKESELKDKCSLRRSCEGKTLNDLLDNVQHSSNTKKGTEKKDDVSKIKNYRLSSQNNMKYLRGDSLNEFYPSGMKGERDISTPISSLLLDQSQAKNQEEFEDVSPKQSRNAVTEQIAEKKNKFKSNPRTSGAELEKFMRNQQLDAFLGSAVDNFDEEIILHENMNKVEKKSKSKIFEMKLDKNIADLFNDKSGSNESRNSFGKIQDCRKDREDFSKNISKSRDPKLEVPRESSHFKHNAHDESSQSTYSSSANTVNEMQKLCRDLSDKSNKSVNHREIMKPNLSSFNTMEKLDFYFISVSEYELYIQDFMKSSNRYLKTPLIDDCDNTSIEQGSQSTTGRGTKEYIINKAIGFYKESKSIIDSCLQSHLTSENISSNDVVYLDFFYAAIESQIKNLLTLAPAERSDMARSFQSKTSFLEQNSHLGNLGSNTTFSASNTRKSFFSGKSKSESVVLDKNKKFFSNTDVSPPSLAVKNLGCKIPLDLNLNSSVTNHLGAKRKSFFSTNKNENEHHFSNCSVSKSMKRTFVDRAHLQGKNGNKWWENQLQTFSKTNFTPLHSSSNSTLYLIESPLKEQVVIKIFNVTRSFPWETPKSLQMEQENNLTNDIQHPAIRRILGKTFVENNPTLVLEKIDGETLTKTGKISDPIKILKIAYEIVDVVRVLHTNKVTHKYLSPDHIFLLAKSNLSEFRARVKIIDFSYSCRFDDKLMSCTVSQKSSTRQQIEGANRSSKSQDRMINLLHCMAPEMTSSNNKGIDYRCDFYSIGVILYYIFSGGFPFPCTFKEYKNKVEELLLNKVKKNPELLTFSDSTLSSNLNIFLKKMMAKNPDNRYQCAMGILHDLDKLIKMYSSLNEHKSIINFGESDCREYFLLEHKLYGRENESKAMLGSITKVKRQMPCLENNLAFEPQLVGGEEDHQLGSSQEETFSRSVELILVSSPSGYGKSVFVTELCSSLCQEGALFIQGAFHKCSYLLDQAVTKVKFQQIRPFSAFIEACSDFCKYLLLESDNEERDYFKKKLSSTLKEEGKLLIDVIPDFVQIIGEKRDLKSMLGTQAKQRFSFVFCKFIKCIASKKNPLIIFIDDLHRADADSIQLLKSLLYDINIKNFVFIGALNSEECVPDDLKVIFNEVQDFGVPTTKINLPPFCVGEIRLMLKDSMKITNQNENDIYSLSLLIKSKTKGNPYLVVQMLKYLVSKNFVFFDRNQRVWKWDVHKINYDVFGSYTIGIDSAGNRNGNFDLNSLLLKNLDPKTHQVLNVVTCIATPFFSFSSLKLLMTASDINVDAAFSVLLKERIIMEVPSRKFETRAEISRNSSLLYQFSHDKIHEVAYSLMKRKDCELIHFHIGMKLWSNEMSQSALVHDKNLFSVTYFLNFALKDIRSLIKCSKIAVFPVNDKEVIIDIVALNLRAAVKSIESTAYFAASSYLCCALELIHMINQQDEEFSFHNEECKRTNCWDPSNKRVYRLALQVHNNLAETYFCQGELCKMEHIVEIVVQNASGVVDKIPMHLLRIKVFNQSAQYEEALQTCVWVLKALGEDFAKFNDDFTLYDKLMNIADDLKMIQNEEAICKLKILIELLIPVLAKQPMQLKSILIRIIQLTLKFGIYPEASIQGIATYGALLCHDECGIRKGVCLGNLARKLLGKFQQKECGPKAFAVIMFWINHWQEHVHMSLKLLISASKVALQVGLRDISTKCINVYCMYSFVSGKKPLGELHSEYSSFMYRCNNLPLSTPTFLSHFHAVRALTIEDEKNFDSKITLDTVTSGGYNTETDEEVLYLPLVMIAFYFYEYRKAAELSEKRQSTNPTLFCTYHSALFVFYDGLIAIEMAWESCSPESGTPSGLSSVQTLVEIVCDCERKMSTWSQVSGQNFTNKLSLLQAELFAFQGKEKNAIEAYKNAIEWSQSLGFLNEEALSYERLGLYFLRRKPCNYENATIYMTKAFLAYRKWGAESKMRHLESKFSQLIKHVDNIEEVISRRQRSNSPKITDIDSIFSNRSKSTEASLSRLS